MKKSFLHLCGFLLLGSICAQELSYAADWKSNAVVYGISPYYMHRGHTHQALLAIRDRLPEIKDLGANVIWLMPVTVPASPGQGYDVIDFEQVWSELGSEDDLRSLVSRAHELGLRVILDTVTNHASARHPFIDEIARHRARSPYDEFFQRDPIADVPYARFFNRKSLATIERSFIYYFWPELLNFNYASHPLRHHVLESLKNWVRKFDVDGFRFDASWGPSSRWPEFYRTISTELRAVKSDLALLAEDKAGYPAEYHGTSHPHFKGSSFDWAYDWNHQDPDWVSKWSFAIEENATAFNAPDAIAATEAFLAGLNQTRATGAIQVLRYLENNDTPGFRRYHSEAETRFAAEIMFLLPGVPLVFYGQEIGSSHDQWALESFDPARSIRSYDPRTFDFYKRLIQRRRDSPVLSRGTIENVRRIGAHTVRFQRRLEEKVLSVDLDFKTRKIKLGN